MKRNNEDRRFGSAKYYYWRLEWYRKKLRWMAYTDTQRHIAYTRATLNPEDKPFYRLRKIIDKIKSLFRR